MTFSRKELRGLALKCIGDRRLPKTLRVHTDTTDFFRIDYDDILILDDHPYLIRNNEKEGRFGIDEQPKFWVKRAIDLIDGSTKIVKMVFKERFQARVGPIVFDCIRSPAKEARVIELVSDHDNFMHGFSIKDSSDNLVRVIDYIRGKRFPYLIESLDEEHDHYFTHRFPSIFRSFIELAKAIKFLHDNKERHGDIRRDHIIIDNETGKLRWIDFDFNYSHHENKFGYDIFGLGNILIYIVGKGDVTIQSLMAKRLPEYSKIKSNDLNIIFHNRVVNLMKVYPYIPEELNTILLHFSTGANVFYDNISDFLDDISKVEIALEKV
jgi:serine/threonine protein kinase